MATSYTSDKKIGSLDVITGSLAAGDKFIVEKNGDALQTTVAQVEEAMFNQKTSGDSPRLNDIVVIRRGSLIRQLETQNLIPDGTVTTVKIADSNVTTLKIADSNVTTAKIADSNVTTAKIADSNVTTTKIADSNVTTAKIADSGVTTAKIADSNVTTAKIADSNVTTAKIANLNVTVGKLENSLDLSSKTVTLPAAQPLSRPVLTGVREAIVNVGTVNGSQTLNLNNGNIFQVKPNGAITVAFSNVPASGTFVGVLIRHEGDGTARTYTWPVTTKWAFGEVPTMTSTIGKFDIVSLFTYDGGTTWFGQILGQNY